MALIRYHGETRTVSCGDHPQHPDGGSAHRSRLLSRLPFLSSPLSLLSRYFENVCELDIMFNLEKAHFILDEMVMNGCLIETNKMNVLKPIAMIEKASG